MGQIVIKQTTKGKEKMKVELIKDSKVLGKVTPTIFDIT